MIGTSPYSMDITNRIAFLTKGSCRFRLIPVCVLQLLIQGQGMHAVADEKSMAGFVPSTVLEFNSTPTRIPSKSAVDAPLLGNGDMKIALGGDPSSQRYHLSKNDLWRLQNGDGKSSPVAFGELRLEIPALKGAPYELRQPLDAPRTESVHRKGELLVRQSSLVAADRNLLWVRLDAEGGPVDVKSSLHVMGGRGAVTETEVRDGVLFGALSFEDEVVDIPSGVAVAMKVLGGALTDGGGDDDRPVTVRHHVEIGREQYGSGRWGFNGRIDDFQVHGASLDAKDVQAVMKGTHQDKPVYRWDFDQMPDGAHGVKPVDGKHGKALHFPGASTSRVEVGMVDMPKEDVCVTGWIFIEEASPEANYLFSCGEWDEGLSLGLSAGKLRFSIDGEFIDSKPLPLRKWVHVAGSWDGARLAVFVDGQLVAKKTDASTSVGGSFRLMPGQPVDLLVVMDSRFDSPDYKARVVETVRDLEMGDLDKIEKAHGGWWQEYWKKSWVDIGDPVLEKAYYLGLYGMGACSRDPRFPPGIFGWDTTNAPHWHGDYHLNYNHVAPFYALYGANRLEQADPQDAPLLAFRERGRWYAENVTRTRGVLYPVGIGPLGIETTHGSQAHGSGPNVELGGMFFQQRSNSAYSLVNIAQRWRCTYDPEYARQVYPLVKDVAEFWEDYLKFEDGRHVIVGDAIHEGSGQNMNPILSLGLVRNSLDLALDMSEELGVDAESRKKWNHILATLSGWTTQDKNGKAVFRYTEKGTSWWRDNTLGIQHIYPGNCIGLDSDPKWLGVARNTIDVMGRWIDYNGSNSFFPAAVRVGYDAEEILVQLRKYAGNTYPNGFQNGNPHGIEHYSTVPNTINEMLCMSHVPVGDAKRKESDIRVFPVWPKDRDASFQRIRTWGAFLVSSELKNREVQFVEITSEKGRPCNVVNPWPGRPVSLIHGERKEILKGERLSVAIAAGDTVVLKPGAAADTGVIERDD